MKRLVCREMIARRWLLTLFMLIWSGLFIVCNHALVWGKNDPEGKVKNARVSLPTLNCWLVSENCASGY